MQTRKIVVFMMLALALVLGTAVVHAITIVVDGVKEAAWDGEGGQTPGIQEDVNEPEIADGRDIKEFRWTNDGEYMYFLMETYANTIWTGNPAPTLIICLDIDNNVSTGGTYGNCDDMEGIDRSIIVTRFGVEILDSDANTGINIETGNEQLGRATVYAEVAVELSTLGINAEVCNTGIRTAIYFDGGTTDPDDNLPDEGTFLMYCGAGGPGDPTAVSLQSFTSVSSNLPAVGLVGMLALVIVSFGIAVVRRERRA